MCIENDLAETEELFNNAIIQHSQRMVEYMEIFGEDTKYARTFSEERDKLSDTFQKRT